MKSVCNILFLVPYSDSHLVGDFNGLNNRNINNI